MELGKLTEVQMGYPFRSRLQHNPQGDVAVIQMKDISDANLLQVEDTVRVLLPNGKAHHLLRAGDLVFRSRGRSNGAAQVLNSIGPAVLAAPMLLIRPHSVLPQYLCWYINAPATQAHLATMAEGTSVQMISTDALKTLDIPLPSPATQQQIVRIAALADRERSLSTQVATLRERLTTQSLLKFAHKATA